MSEELDKEIRLDMSLRDLIGKPRESMQRLVKLPDTLYSDLLQPPHPFCELRRMRRLLWRGADKYQVAAVKDFGRRLSYAGSRQRTSSLTQTRKHSMNKLRNGSRYVTEVIRDAEDYHLQTNGRSSDWSMWDYLTIRGPHICWRTASTTGIM